MPKKVPIFYSALLLTGVNLLLRLVGTSFQVYLSGRIGAAGVGLLQLTMSVGNLAMVAGMAGIRTATMYLTAEELGRRQKGNVTWVLSACFLYSLLCSGTAAAVLFGSASRISRFWIGDIRTAGALRLLAVFLPVTCLCGVMTGYFTACSRIRQLVVIEIAERLVSMLITVVLLLTWALGDLERACCAITFGSSAGCIFDFLLLYFMYRRDVRHVPPPDRELHMPRRLLRLCVPLALNDYLRAGLNTAEQLLIPYGLARYSSSGEAAMAAYGTIHGMVFPILMFPAAILYSVSDLLVPELSRSRAMQRNLRIVDLTDKCVRMGFLFAAAVSGFLLVTARELGELIYQSADAGLYLLVFAPMVLMLYLDAIVDGMLKGLAEQISCVRYNTFTSVLDVVFLYLLLPRWGIRAYVFTFAVTHAINLFLSLRRLLSVAAHRMRASDFLRPLVSYLLSLLPFVLLPVGAGSPLLTLFLRGGSFLLLLCAVFLLTGALAPRDYRWLQRVFRRSIDTRRNSG